MTTGVMIIGVGFFLKRVAGDKNYWVDILPMITGEEFDVTAVSINDLPSSADIIESSGTGVSLVNWGRSLHTGNRKRFFASSPGGTDYHHKHNPAQEQLELVTTLMMHLPELRRVIRERQVKVIHVMDNMGFGIPLLKILFPKLLVTHSAMTYMPRGRNYDRYLKVCFSRLDKVAAYSEAYAEMLPRLGVSPEKIEVIRWGVVPGRNVVTAEEKSEVRSKLGLSKDCKLILWSGPIQQIQESDFFTAVEAARQVAASREDVRFIFSFKPCSFKEEYRQYEADRVKIGAPDVDFPKLLGSADLFLSPLGNTRSTLAPPLTWLEAMNNGVGVITTPALGVDESVIDGETGYVAGAKESISDVINRALDDTYYDLMSRNCCKLIADKFDIRKSAEAYKTFWKTGLQELHR